MCLPAVFHEHSVLYILPSQKLLVGVLNGNGILINLEPVGKRHGNKCRLWRRPLYERERAVFLEKPLVLRKLRDVQREVRVIR